MRWKVLVEGFAGHPLHPPLTDATIGAFTVGTIAAVGARLGLFSDVLAPTALAAVIIGLVFAVPTAITGVADLLAIRQDAPAKTVAYVHMAIMVVAIVGFFLAALLLASGTTDAEVTTSATFVTVASYLVLAGGGWVGGSLAYVYGIRVLAAPETPPADAIRPGHATHPGERSRSEPR